MEARLTELNYNEILMYLGYKGQEISDSIEAQIRSCADKITRAASPKLVYRVLPVEGGSIEGFPIEGNDMKKLLSDSHQAVMVAMTLGPQVETLMGRYEVMDMADAVIMDACASVAIENVANNFENDLRTELEQNGLFLTSRYSPGYGDVPLDTQKRLCEALNASKRIGLNITDNFIMVPRKSVTAIIGISHNPQELRPNGCETCSMFMTCRFRKEGKECEKIG